jgi:nicotinamide-nucleotide amidase
MHVARGSSDWFERGFVTYSNAAKTEMLGVADELIVRHGAVSAEVANAMAAGALAHSKAQLAVAVTGIAGPSGATRASRSAPCGSRGTAATGAASVLLQLGGDRAAIRRQTCSRRCVR